MENYIKCLQNHDWWYMMSDDGRVYSAGDRAAKSLRSQQMNLDPEGIVWNQYCPKEFYIKRDNLQILSDIGETSGGKYDSED